MLIHYYAVEHGDGWRTWAAGLHFDAEGRVQIRCMEIDMFEEWAPESVAAGW